MRTKWMIHNRKADFFGLGKMFGVDPVVIRVLRNRGVTDEADFRQFLQGTVESVEKTHLPELMLDMDLGVDIIASSIETGENIRVVGDYDVDGVTSTYILYDAIKRAGGNVSYDIPHRIWDGYGINERIIRKAYEESVSTIITCDNGIAATEAITLAKELGLNVVITDHHELPDVLPPADAIIDPHQEGDDYPYEDICGAMVAYKFVRYLYQTMGIMDKFGENAYLDVLALATVCDVMPLCDENRVYVRAGLKVLPETKIMGLRTLLGELGLLDRPITGYSLGFVLGPTINAAGKLGDAKDAVELLITEDEDFARERARELVEENDRRKQKTEDGYKKAVEEMDIVETESGEEAKDDVIMAYIPDIPEGIAGIIAGRLRERFYRPVVVFTDTDSDADLLKGSGRSIEAYNMFEKLGEHKDMMVKFGGHPMAAGMTIRRENLDELRRLVNRDSGLSEEDLTKVIKIDVPMPLSYATMNLAEQLENLGPFGKGNEAPLFGVENMEIVSYEIRGEKQNLLQVKLRDADGRIFVMKNFRPMDFESDINRWFGKEECDKIKSGTATGKRIHIIYRLDINEFRGNRSLEYMLENWLPA